VTKEIHTIDCVFGQSDKWCREVYVIVLLWTKCNKPTSDLLLKPSIIDTVDSEEDGEDGKGEGENKSRKYNLFFSWVGKDCSDLGSLHESFLQFLQSFVLFLFESIRIEFVVGLVHLNGEGSGYSMMTYQV